MGKCYDNQYTTNETILHGALICHGGFGQPRCKYADKCLEDNGYEIRVTKSGKSRIRKKKDNG